MRVWLDERDRVQGEPRPVLYIERDEYSPVLTVDAVGGPVVEQLRPPPPDAVELATPAEVIADLLWDLRDALSPHAFTRLVTAVRDTANGPAALRAAELDPP